MQAQGDCEWKDGTLQTEQSELGQKIRYASFGGNPWVGVGQHPGIRVWRVNGCRISPWPPEENGCFFDEDVFIVLSTHFPDVMSSDLAHNVHIWVGKQASLEDYNMAVLLVPGLHKVLVPDACLHRDVSGRESDNFRSYFITITVSHGVASDSYRYNPDDACSARLFRYYKSDRHSDQYRVKEVAPLKANLQPEHNYVMDIGQKIHLWSGRLVTAEEKFGAIGYCEELCRRRGPTTNFEVLDQDKHEGHYFYFYLQDRGEGTLLDSDDDTSVNVTRQATLTRKNVTETLAFRVLRNGGETVAFKRIKASRRDLASQAASIVDSGDSCFVWLGKKSSRQDGANALRYAHEYLKHTNHPYVPVKVVTNEQKHPALVRTLSK